VLGDAPQLAGAHKPGLHLIGDVEGAVALAEVLDGAQVARRGQWEPVGGRDRLHDHRGDVPGRQGLVHRVEVVERHVGELVRPVGEEQAREPLVAGRDGQPGMPVVRLGDRDHPPPSGGVPGRLERDVDRLAAPAAVHHLGDAVRRGGDQRLGQRGAGDRGEVVVADVEVGHGLRQRGDDLRVAVPEVVRAAVEVHVDEALAADVVDQVPLAPPDHERYAGLRPEPRLARVPEPLGLRQQLFLGRETDEFPGHGHLSLIRSTKTLPLQPFHVKWSMFPAN
jgi:hypothetical protein